MPGYYAVDYNPWQGATYPEMAKYLAAKSGLDYQVALNWLHAEGSQQHGNPLGYGYTKERGPVSFGNWRQGLDAAVNLLRTSSYYRPIEAAIAGGSPAAERAAIVNSPWSGTTYSHGASFSTAGISGTVPTVGAAPGKAGPGTPASSSTGGQVTILQPSAAGELAGFYPIPRASIGDPSVQCASGYVPGIVSVGPIQTLQGFVSPESVPGQANACVKAGTAEGSRPSGVPDIAGAITGLPGAIAGATITLGLLGVVAALGWSGAKDLLGD